MPDRRSASHQLRRLRAEQQQLESLAQASSRFTCRASGDPPDRYLLRFHGRGIGAVQERTGTPQVVWVEEHRCKLRLGIAFPWEPPTVHWLTKIFHPNVRPGGLLSVRDIGLDWSPEMSLETLCLRLWDVARLAWFDLERPKNHLARVWLARALQAARPAVALPSDPRPLREVPGEVLGNVIAYRFSDQGTRLELTATQDAACEVLYIDEQTAPADAAPPLPSTPDEPFYIGDEPPEETPRPQPPPLPSQPQSGQPSRGNGNGNGSRNGN